MSSSQALAQSVFGNLRAAGRQDALFRVLDDEGRPLLGNQPESLASLSLESPVRHLGEPRPTSIDVNFGGTAYSVAFECKLTEPEVGTCSRPRLGVDDPQACNGLYSHENARNTQLGLRQDRCPLTTLGVQYWKYIPLLFRWSADEDMHPCPIDATYQLVRNVLAVCIRGDGTISPDGSVVLIYDDRNPTFQAGGRGYLAFELTKAALKPSFASALRKASWQRITQSLRERDVLNWLTDELAAKYGL